MIQEDYRIACNRSNLWMTQEDRIVCNRSKLCMIQEDYRIVCNRSNLWMIGRQEDRIELFAIDPTYEWYRKTI